MMQRRAHTLASPLAAASEHRTLVSTASAPLRQTRRSCAEQDLSSHAHCVPTSVADPAFAWRYRRAREEKEVPVISSELSPQRAIKTSPSLTHTQRPMAMLFPGSGSQYASMGSFLLKTYATAREVWEEAEEALADFEKWRDSLELPADPALSALKLDEWSPWKTHFPPDALRRVVFGKTPSSVLMKSSNAQPAILITSIAYLRVVEQELGIPLSTQYARYFMGHSSGEYTAAIAAGALSFRDAVRITRLHGLLTSRTLMTSKLEPPLNEDVPPHKRAQMSALLVHPGRSSEEISAIVQATRQKYGMEGEGMVFIAAFNSSAQVVLSGTRAGVEHACDALEMHGIASKATDLPTWVPFHTPVMKSAEAGVRLALDRGVKLSSVRENTAMVSCVDGQLVSSPTEIADCLIRQISMPVRWSLALANLRHVFDTKEFIYLGPHKALAHLASNEASQLGLPDEVMSIASKEGLNEVQARYASQGQLS